MQEVAWIISEVEQDSGMMVSQCVYLLDGNYLLEWNDDTRAVTALVYGRDDAPYQAAVAFFCNDAERGRWRVVDVMVGSAESIGEDVASFLSGDGNG